MTSATGLRPAEPGRRGSGSRPRGSPESVGGSDEHVERLLIQGLDQAAHRLEGTGLPIPPRQGKLLRPMFAVSMTPRRYRDRLDAHFWAGALAIQMVHEASLLHDDVIDGASERRGRPTLVAEEGVARAVVLGDRYLTAAYRAAASTGSFEFLSRFTEAVERTVAGEMAQGRSAGRYLTEAEYDEIIEEKSGELFGIAAALGSTVGGLGSVERRQALGRAFGNLYQRIDDLVDYCGRADTGKPAFQDYRSRKWSWVLGLASVHDFELPDEEVAAAIFGADGLAPSPARKALEILEDRKREILRRAAGLDADIAALDALLSSCTSAARRYVTEQEQRMGLPRIHGVPQDAAMRDAHRSQEAVIRRKAEALGGPAQWRAYFGGHARTFSLAARLFPPREAALVTGLYAYCRFTDDLVDEPEDDPSQEVLSLRLDVWRELSLAAFDGTVTEIPLLDAVMAQAAAKGVDRVYPEALLDGVGMDLSPRRYHTWEELERYTFGVAGAVGGWMTQLFGLHDPELLDRAHALGHGMQLTNIARDVGEDWRGGRLYLPTELLLEHAVSPEDLAAMVGGSMEISDPYRDAVEQLIARADAYYEQAWPGIRALPPFFRRPVAAAAAAYRGIHREIRRNDYDNLTERAYTSVSRKVLLAGAGLINARRSS